MLHVDSVSAKPLPEENLGHSKSGGRSHPLGDGVGASRCRTGNCDEDTTVARGLDEPPDKVHLERREDAHEDVGHGPFSQQAKDGNSASGLDLVEELSR